MGFFPSGPSVAAVTAGGTGLSSPGAGIPWVASDNGLLAAVGDIAPFAATTVVTAGTLYLVKLIIRAPMTITNVVLGCAAAGVGASTGSFVGLYNSGGTLLSGSADVGAAFTSSGVIATALTLPQAVTAGSFVWVAFLFNLATTQPSISRGLSTASLTDPGLTAAGFRFAHNGTGLAALPASITPSANIAEFAYWAAAS